MDFQHIIWISVWVAVALLIYLVDKFFSKKYKLQNPVEENNNSNTNEENAGAHINAVYFTSLRKLNLNDKGQKYTPLKFTNLNIFIGVNGAGKSTVLDILHCFLDPCKITTLMRENNPTYAHSKIEIALSTNQLLLLNLHTQTDQKKPEGEEGSIDYHDLQAVHFTEYLQTEEQLPIQIKKSNCEYNFQAINRIFQVYSNVLNVYYLNQDTDFQTNAEDIVNILNKISNHLSGVLNENTKQLLVEQGREDLLETLNYDQRPNGNFSCQNSEDEKINFTLSDDLNMENVVPIKLLPSGWLSIIRILTFIQKAEQNSICLIEEPETHLHPKLQRVLIDEIKEQIDQKNLQVFMTTHSSVFINTKSENNVDVSLFEATTDTIEKLKNPHRLLDNLGVKASDLLQTNGIIWIEGPSDRIYIKHWLKLWCEENDKTCPIENKDYSFSMYGGSILSHFSADEDTDSFIDMIKMNRNAIVIIDNDNHFDQNGNLRPNMGQTKGRVIREIESLNRKNSYTWVTRNYTIESYLRDDFINEYFAIDANGKLTLRSNKSKVEASVKYARETNSFEDKDDLSTQIENLFNTILKWNQS